MDETKTTESIEMAQSEKEKKEFSQRFNTAVEHAGLAGLTNEELGTKLGKVSGPAVSYWSRGKKVPSIVNGIIIAKGLGVSLEWLMTGRGKMLEGRRTTPEAEALLLIYEGSSNEAQVQMLLAAAHQAWVSGDHEQAEQLREMAEKLKHDT